MDTAYVDRNRKGEIHASCPDSRPYVLGESEAEFRRLEMQSAFVRDLTEDVLKRAGLKSGMRVLDIGCGVGDVALLAGELVGPYGSVLGIDRSAAAVKTAERRVAQAKQDCGIRFAVADLDSFHPDETFDAIIGRLILMYLPDPAAALRRLVRHLRPGGILAFQELSMPAIRSVPDAPQFLQCKSWILETFERAGFETEMGGKLFTTFLAAGLPAPEMIAAGRAEGGRQSQVYAYIAATLQSLLPAMERAGVATADEVGINDLADRLRDEAVARKACIINFPPLIGAWTTRPE
jgi:ubiquinone/menaquinone biosynthesis C-methylase UbiE